MVHPIRTSYTFFYTLNGWILLCGLFLVLWPTRGVAQPKQASIALATEPGQASFRLMNIQGKLIRSGTTPYVGVLPAGRYRLVLSKEGFFTEQRGLSLVLGQQKIVRIVLMKKKASSTVQAPTKRPLSRSSRSQKTKKVKSTGATHVPSTKNTHPEKASPSHPRSSRTKPPSVKASKTASSTSVKHSKATKPSGLKRSIPWIPIVAAAGLGIAGGVFFALSNGSLEASKDRNKFQRDAFQEYQRARTHRSTATFLFAASGVAVVLGALFYFWNPSKTKKKGKVPAPKHSTVVGFSYTYVD